MGDILIESINAIILALILLFLIFGTRKIKSKGMDLVISGFVLLFLGALVDITDNFPVLNGLVLLGDTPQQAFLEKVVCFLGGYCLLALGFWKWLPNITKLRESKDALRISEERYKSLIENMNFGVTLIDKDYTIVMTNQAQSKLFNKGENYFVNKQCFKVFEKRDDVCPHCPGAVAMAERKPAEACTEGVLDSGERFSVHIRAVPLISDKTNEVEGFIEVVEDITEKNKTEAELLKSKKIESVGLLAGGIAHDFNNILAAILGNINLALIDEDLHDKTRDLLFRAEKASLRAKGLTQQLLTFSKGGEPVKETSSLENVIKESASFVLHGEKVACHYDIPKDLWLADIDKGQISQVIQNIVINACQAMPEGGVLEISCENLTSVGQNILPQGKGGKYLKICIRDRGAGIPKNILEKIFDPYFSTKQDGSGLGLAISQSIINKHNGNILAESSPGEGATFIIYLPASEKTTPLSPRIIGEHKAISQAMILIMDDDEMVKSVAEAMLVQLGHEVTLSVDGDEAIRLYQDSLESEKPFDLLIMDLTIPGGMGGEEAAQEILKCNPEAKIIVASGYSNDPIMANFRDYGFCSAIAKPFQLQELSSVISQILG